MSSNRYPTDLSDAEWSLLEPHLPVPKRRGRPRVHSPREILNAVFYVLKSGCQWRMLPREIPPWKTVFHCPRSGWHQAFARTGPLANRAPYPSVGGRGLPRSRQGVGGAGARLGGRGGQPLPKTDPREGPTGVGERVV